MPRLMQKLRRGRCVICGKWWITEMTSPGGNVSTDPCPYCNTTPCIMDFLADYVLGTSKMSTEKAIEYVVTLETQSECELCIEEEILGRKNNSWREGKAREEVIDAIMLRYDFLDETGVTERGKQRWTAKELIKYHLGKESNKDV